MNLVAYIIALIKSEGIYEGEDVNISINELISLDHSIPPHEIITAIADGLEDIQIEDKGFIIPKKYFK